MQVYPSLAQVKAYQAGGQYDIVPLKCELLSDFITPIEALRKLKAVYDHCFLLESAQNHERWGRYTFIGFAPKMSIGCQRGTLTIDGVEQATTHPKQELRVILSQYRSPRLDGFPPFTGGLVGYFSFDYLAYSEPSLQTDQQDTDFKDVDLMLFDRVIAFDHFAQKLILMAHVRLQEVENSYQQATEALQEVAQILQTGTKKANTAGKLLGEMTPRFRKSAFCDMVERAKRAIFEGDLFQIVLSNRLSAPFKGSLLGMYRRLRTINPSPYLFYFAGEEIEFAGASPETLVKLEDGVLHTFPLAGTRPRGKTRQEDERLEQELLSDAKELAEHHMLVDLGRNDLGKISAFGTVAVEELCKVVRFSHVMHIGSTVRGQIRAPYDALDAIEAVLPAGTLSGAPKIRACQIIHELEQCPRGIYGGAIGYIDFTGNMDTCIAIRLAYQKNGQVFVRGGAGIVADSDPVKEYEECIHKAKATMRALEMAQEEQDDCISG